MPKPRIAPGLSVKPRMSLARYIENEFEDIERKLGSGRGWRNPKWEAFAARLRELGIRNQNGKLYSPQVAKATYARVKARLLKKRAVQEPARAQANQAPAKAPTAGTLEARLRAKLKR